MQIKIDNKVVMELTDADKIYLKHWLFDDEGIIKWIVGAIKGKVNKRKKKFFLEWQQKLMADPSVDSIPANEDDFRNMVISRPDYKDRKQREEEEEKRKNRR